MNNKLKRLMAILLIFTLTASFGYAETFSAIVSADEMPVFSSDDLFEELGTLAKNTLVTVLESDDGVVKLSYKGRTGYASVGDLKSIEDIATPATVTASTHVYASASKAAKSVKVKKGQQVNLIDIKGNWACIERGGYLGFILADKLTTVSGDEQDETASDDITADSDVITCNFKATVTAKKLTVYASASTKAKKLGAMSKGTVVTVLAYNKTWAYIDLDGHRGHVKHSGLTKEVAEESPTVTPTPTPEPTPTPKPDYTSSKYSNEEIIYAFLINECGFNTAAACGVLANIKAESGFRPEALNSIGCYGICQWYAGRRTRLNNFCEENGYDSSTLVGQLWYLKYELQNHYKGTWNYLRGVSNDAQGAYDAGYYWCYYFEVPGNRTANSIKRGNSAQDTYWPKYSK